MPIAALALAALAAAAAAPAAPADVPLAAFTAYGHPEIAADACKAKDASHTVCVIPAKTMGRYMVEVSATSTATGPDATQAIAIGGPGWVCGEGASKKGDWSTGARTTVAQCIITVLNDNPVQVVAVFGGANAKLDPAGPIVTIRRMPWDGVLATGAFQAGIKAPPAAPTK